MKCLNNFERITENADALAIFLTMSGLTACDVSDCDKCKFQKQCQKSNYPKPLEIWQAWLKQECDEEWTKKIVPKK